MIKTADDHAGAGLVLLGLGLLPLLILFVVWMICAIVAASIADHRGRSPCGSAVLHLHAGGGRSDG